MKNLENKRLNKEISTLTEWNKILDFVENHVQNMDHINISTAIHRCAKDLRMKPHEIPDLWKKSIFKEMLEKLRLKLSSCKPQELSNCIWALAILEANEEDFFNTWCVTAENMFVEYRSQHFSNTLWALAKLQ